jgi:hypothetical protein
VLVIRKIDSKSAHWWSRRVDAEGQPPTEERIARLEAIARSGRRRMEGQ